MYSTKLSLCILAWVLSCHHTRLASCLLNTLLLGYISLPQACLPVLFVLYQCIYLNTNALARKNTSIQMHHEDIVAISLCPLSLSYWTTNVKTKGKNPFSFLLSPSFILCRPPSQVGCIDGCGYKNCNDISDNTKTKIPMSWCLSQPRNAKRKLFSYHTHFIWRIALAINSLISSCNQVHVQFSTNVCVWSCWIKNKRKESNKRRRIHSVMIKEVKQ